MTADDDAQILRQKLRREFESGQASIAQDKATLMEGTKTSQWAMKMKLKREAELKERIAAFAVFTKNAEKAKKLSRNLQATAFERNRIFCRSLFHTPSFNTLLVLCSIYLFLQQEFWAVEHCSPNQFGDDNTFSKPDY